MERNSKNVESIVNYLKVLISNLCLENRYLLKNLDSFPQCGKSFPQGKNYL